MIPLPAFQLVAGAEAPLSLLPRATSIALPFGIIDDHSRGACKPDTLSVPPRLRRRHTRDLQRQPLLFHTPPHDAYACRVAGRNENATH